MRCALAVIAALLAFNAHAQITRNTLPDCHAVPSVAHIVTRSDGRCEAYTAKDASKLPNHAKSGPAVAPGPTIEERVKALEDKLR